MDDLPKRFQNLMNAMRRNNPKLRELHIDQKELGILLLEQHDDDDDTQQIIEKEQNLSSSFSCKENNDDTSDHSYDLNYHNNTTSSSNITRRKKIDDLLCCDSGTLHYYMGLLCESMRNNYTIDTVSLDMNMITQSLSNQTIKSLCHSVGRLSKMQSLTLYGKQGGGNYDNNNYEKSSQMIEISWLTSILNTSTNLQSLSIYNANIVAKTKQEEIEFITAMKVLGCTTLTKILCFQVHFLRLYNDNDDHYNDQGLCIFNDFIQSLPSCVSKLQELRIVNQKLNTFSIHNNNQTTNQMLFSSSSSITKMQQQHQYQSPLSLSSSSILLSEGAIKNIFKMENLKILALNGMDLSNNKSTMQTLAESIEQSLAPIESLNLSCNNIDDDGCILLFQSLEQNNKTSSTTTTTSNTGLKELNIASNSFTAKSAHSISNYLRSCDSSSSTGSSSSKVLKHLNLNSNNITDMGCVLIARSLCSNTSLETLHMSYCNLHDDGIYALSCALLYNRTLQKLYIKYNQGITMNGYQSLLQILMEHKNHIIDTIAVNNENNNNNNNNKHPLTSSLMFNKLKFYLNLNKSKIQHKLLLEDNNVSRNVWIKDLLSIQDMMPKKEGTSTTTTLNNDCSNIVDITSTIYFYVRSKPSLLLYCAC